MTNRFPPASSPQAFRETFLALVEDSLQAHFRLHGEYLAGLIVERRLAEADDPRELDREELCGLAADLHQTAAQLSDFGDRGMSEWAGLAPDLLAEELQEIVDQIRFLEHRISRLARTPTPGSPRLQ